MPHLCLMVRVFLVALLALWPAIAAADSVVSGTQDCLDAPYQIAESPNQQVLRDRVLDLRTVLEGFPSLLRALDMQRPQICLSDRLLMEKGFLNPEDNRIVVARDLHPDFMMAVLVHEIRHVDHLVRGICPSDTLAMKQYARATSFLEADANAIGLLIAWNQKIGGNPGMWQALANWKMTSDIAERFSITMRETGDISLAVSAAFDQWFASAERRRLYYFASCSAYLDRQDQTHVLPQYLKLSPDFLTHLCRMPDGETYQCDFPQGDLKP